MLGHVAVPDIEHLRGVSILLQIRTIQTRLALTITACLFTADVKSNGYTVDQTEQGHSSLKAATPRSRGTTPRLSIRTHDLRQQAAQMKVTKGKPVNGYHHVPSASMHDDEVLLLPRDEIRSEDDEPSMPTWLVATA